MRKAFGKLKAFLPQEPKGRSSPPPVPPPVGAGHLPKGYYVEVDKYRYRKHRGVNLGSWFVLEHWISESPFRNARPPAQSDLDVAKGEGAKGILEQHWDTWITEEDWAWLAEKGINTVRIPIGYYHICGIDPSILHGTDFEGLYVQLSGAWNRIKSALATAHRYGIGVLFDLHAAPGKQNSDSHSGTSLQPSFFDNPTNMAHTIRVLATFVSHVTSFARTHSPPLPNLVGIELLNEPHPGAHSDALKDWYLRTFHAIRALDPTLPLYISDCWAPEQYAEFAKSADTPFLALDHHLYRCFTDSDIKTPVGEHARRLRDRTAGTPAEFARAAAELEGAGGALIVGEWSAALNPGSLREVEDEREARREYVEAQLELFEEHCAGWFFWTYKKEQGSDKGWSFRDALEAGVLPLDLGRTVYECQEAGRAERMYAAREAALDLHTSYWAQYPGNYDHRRFFDGFTAGWEDATLFVSSGQELGFKGPWVKRRVKEYTAKRGPGNEWEFEHGFSQAFKAS